MKQFAVSSSKGGRRMVKKRERDENVRDLKIPNPGKAMRWLLCKSIHNPAEVFLPGRAVAVLR